MTKLEKINLPEDMMRGPAQGYGTEHGDNWVTAGRKINAAIDALNGDFETMDTAVSNAGGNATGNADGMKSVMDDFGNRLEILEIAVAEMMKWLGIKSEEAAPEAAALAPEPSPPLQMGGSNPDPQTIGQSDVGTLSNDVTAASGSGPNLAQDPRNVVTTNEVFPVVGDAGPSGAGSGGVKPNDPALADAPLLGIGTPPQPGAEGAMLQLADGDYHPVEATADTSGVTTNGNEGQPQADQFTDKPASISTFDGVPGSVVGNTRDEEHDDNRFVASAVTGQKEAEMPVEQTGQKPGAEPVPEEARDATVVLDGKNTPSNTSMVADTPDDPRQPGIAALAEAEAAIPAPSADPTIDQEATRGPGVDINASTDDPIDAVDNPETPPSGETLARANAGKAGTVKIGG